MVIRPLMEYMVFLFLEKKKESVRNVNRGERKAAERLPDGVSERLKTSQLVANRIYTCLSLLYIFTVRKIVFGYKMEVCESRGKPCPFPCWWTNIFITACWFRRRILVISIANIRSDHLKAGGGIHLYGFQYVFHI